MQIVDTALSEVKLIKPKIFGDHRGFFLETYQKERYITAGIQAEFVQDNLSRSQYGVLRGLHLQNPQAQGKLVSVVVGEVFDVAVDVRINSPTFGQWVGYPLTEENKHQLWIPAGFAHGFVVTSPDAIFSYKVDEFYAPQHEISILWNDPDIGIQWPVKDPKLSSKDADAKPLKDIDPDFLMRF